MTTNTRESRTSYHRYEAFNEQLLMEFRGDLIHANDLLEHHPVVSDHFKPDFTVYNKIRIYKTCEPAILLDKNSKLES